MFTTGPVMEFCPNEWLKHKDNRNKTTEIFFMIVNKWISDGLEKKENEICYTK
jgi:hypothetical protein